MLPAKLLVCERNRLLKCRYAVSLPLSSESEVESSEDSVEMLDSDRSVSRISSNVGAVALTGEIRFRLVGRFFPFCVLDLLAVLSGD